MNIKNKVSRDTINDVKLNRDSALNPPSADPGMDDFDWDDFGGTNDPFGGGNDPFGGTNDPFGGGSDPFGGTNDPFGGGNDPFGGGNDPFGGGNDPFGNGSDPWATPPVGGGFPPTSRSEQEFEDKVFDGITKASKGAFSFIKEFVESFSEMDDMVKINTVRTSTFMGGGFAVSGVLLALFGNQYGIPILVGGLITSGVSVPLFSIMYERIMNNGGFEAYENTDDADNGVDAFGSDENMFGESDENGLSGVSFGEEEDLFSSNSDDSFDNMSFSDEDDDDFVIEDDTYDFSNFDDIDDEDDDFVDYTMQNDNTLSVEDTMESILNNINTNNSKGIMTRQYLYDMIINCLMHINPKYDNVVHITEGSDDFEAWDAIIQSSADMIKTGKDTDMPYLISAKDKLFYVLLEVHRPKWLKNVDLLVKEVVSICSFDESSGTRNLDIYGMGETVGNKIYIKIMKGETAMVSLKDMFMNVSKDIKDTKNYMPIVLGVDPEGSVVVKDFKPIDSLLVAGMPRSGKSWFVQALLTQMCMWLKPSELHLYILDPKGATSDFKSFQLPHVKKFVSDDNAILRELRNVVKVEAKRRTKIIGDAGCVNIWDFKKKCPDVDMPLVYVVVDEVITLAERMEKEDKDEFNSLLLELVSRLPNLGIRVIIIPHVVKDQVLKKSITDLIPCRISVRGDATHIEKSAGVKGFKHNLKHSGDMCVKLVASDAMFVHGVVLTDSNEKNNELFDFLTRMWLKLEPESYKGSVKERLDSDFKNGGEVSSNVTIQAPKSVAKSVSKPKVSDDDISDLLKGVHNDTSDDDDDWFMVGEDDI